MSVIVVLGVRCEEHVCITCGAPYTCPEAMIVHQRQNGGYHHCPNGHSQGWNRDGSENAQLRRERDRLKQNEARLEEELRAAERQAAKLKKRMGAGVCPCCTRTFTNMARHMKTKHPDFNVVPLKAVKT